MGKRVLKGLGAGLLLLILVLVGNTLRQGSRQQAVAPVPKLAVDQAGLVQTMAAAVRAKTVSGLLDPSGQAAEFDKLHALLRERFPLAHEKLTREVVGGHSLLFTWKGSDASLPPVALMAHQDVVPIAPGTEALWQKPPFDGVVEGGFVWGRGTLDDKSNVITQLEALEMLLKAGVQPRRTIYFVFGHDEEVGGANGVVKIVEMLKQRGVKLAWVLDEGLAVTEGVMPGLNAPVALIGLAEKGSVSLELTAKAAPGHSSMPPGPGEGAIGRLAQALARLDKQPLPGGIQGAAAEMFASVAPELPFGQRLATSNSDAFSFVEGTVREVFLDALVAPGLMLAASDARHFDGISEASFRFMPIRFNSEDLKRPHGTDERIGVDQLADMVRFYHRLLTQAAQ